MRSKGPPFLGSSPRISSAIVWRHRNRLSPPRRRRPRRSPQLQPPAQVLVFLQRREEIPFALAPITLSSARARTPLHTAARLPFRPAAVAEVRAARARHMRTSAVALDELLTFRAAHPPERVPEAQRGAVRGLVSARVDRRARGGIDGDATAGAGERAASGGWARVDVDRRAFVARAEEAAAARVRAVDAARGGLLHLAHGVILALGGGEEVLEGERVDGLSAAARRELGGRAHGDLNKLEEALGVVQVAARHLNCLFLRDVDVGHTGYTFVRFPGMQMSKK